LPDHYTEHELLLQISHDEQRKTYSTQHGYDSVRYCETREVYRERQYLVPVENKHIANSSEAHDFESAVSSISDRFIAANK
jgi:hypothetical protein